jgi:hypothetical protein
VAVFNNCEGAVTAVSHIGLTLVGAISDGLEVASSAAGDRPHSDAILAFQDSWERKGGRPAGQPVKT